MKPLEEWQIKESIADLKGHIKFLEEEMSSMQREIDDNQDDIRILEAQLPDPDGDRDRRDDR